MKIYFCDKCNESIPIKDMESNRISIDAGKIYCGDCTPKSARAGSNTNYPTVAVAMLLGIGLGMVCMAIWGDAILSTGGGESVSSRISRLDQAVVDLRNGVDRRLGSIDRDLDTSPGIDDKRGKLATALQAIKGNGKVIEENQQGISGLSNDLKKLIDTNEKKLLAFEEDFLDRLKKLGDLVDRSLVADINSLGQKLAAIETILDDVTTRTEALEKRESLAAVPATGDGSSGASTKGAGEDILDPETEKRLQKALAQLASKDAPKRFAAVVDLLEFKTRRAEEAMTSVLDDDAEYVQTAALNNLMEMNARWTIPNIIAKLKDRNVFVREAAITALESLMGKSIALDPNAPNAKILAKIRELEKWWQANKDAMLAD